MKVSPPFRKNLLKWAPLYKPKSESLDGDFVDPHQGDNQPILAL